MWPGLSFCGDAREVGVSPNWKWDLYWNIKALKMLWDCLGVYWSAGIRPIQEILYLILLDTARIIKKSSTRLHSYWTKCFPIPPPLGFCNMEHDVFWFTCAILFYVFPARGMSHRWDDFRVRDVQQEQRPWIIPKFYLSHPFTYVSVIFYFFFYAFLFPRNICMHACCVCCCCC